MVVGKCGISVPRGTFDISALLGMIAFLGITVSRETLGINGYGLFWETTMDAPVALQGYLLLRAVGVARY